jgi:hypothetical protein
MFLTLVFMLLSVKIVMMNERVLKVELEKCPKPDLDEGQYRTAVLQWCHSGVTVVSQWCYSGVTLMSQRCYSGVTVVLQWCYSGVSVVSQWCYSGVTVVLRYRCVPADVKPAPGRGTPYEREKHYNQDGDGDGDDDGDGDGDGDDDGATLKGGQVQKQGIAQQFKRGASVHSASAHVM